MSVVFGALHHLRQQQRIAGPGTEHYLRGALLSTVFDPADPLISLALLVWHGQAVQGDRDLMTYNDASDRDDQVRALMIQPAGTRKPSLRPLAIAGIPAR